MSAHPIHEGSETVCYYILYNKLMRHRNKLSNFKFKNRITLPNGKHGIRMNFFMADQFGHGKIILISDCLNVLMVLMAYLAV